MSPSVRLIHRLHGLAAAFALATFMLPAGAGLATQTSREGAVVVKVTPVTLAQTAANWEFEIVFETHTVALAGDPAQFALLVDAHGSAHAPLRWDGDPPGGHHRKGVLRFRAPVVRGGAIELRLNGVGGVATRTFRWQVP